MAKSPTDEARDDLIASAKTAAFADAIRQVSDLMIAHRPTIIGNDASLTWLNVNAWYDMAHELLELKGRHER